MKRTEWKWLTQIDWLDLIDWNWVPEQNWLKLINWNWLTETEVGAVDLWSCLVYYLEYELILGTYAKNYAHNFKNKKNYDYLKIGNRHKKYWCWTLFSK